MKLVCADGKVLDPRIPHLLGCIGAGWVSGKIRKHSSSLVVLNPEDRWNHVGVLYLDRDGELMVVESHFKTRGVKKKHFESFLQNNQESIVYAFPYPEVSAEATEAYARLQVPYGTRDVGHFLLPWREYVNPDSRGVHCAELIAECDYGNICEFMKLPDDQVMPVHFQEYALEKELEIYGLNGVKIEDEKVVYA